MSNVNEQTADVLNDLIQINNDRIAGYERAENETDSTDVDLKAVFKAMASESRDYASELSKVIVSSGEKASDDTTTKGKIYRAWMDVKATFTGKNRKAILASCEYGEDAAQKAYEEALATDAELSADVRQLITDQKAKLKKSHDKMKAMRDAQPA